MNVDKYQVFYSQWDSMWRVLILKNVSRPPSPSVRALEPGLDTLDNDKGSNSSLHLPSNSDSASVSSATDLVTVINAGKGDNPKVQITSPAGARGADGTARSKKKSWYNALYPTYKSKSDDFKRLFKDLPDDERLIVGQYTATTLPAVTRQEELVQRAVSHLQEQVRRLQAAVQGLA
ncbi:protein Aster-A-like isoform X2 [Ostrinia nubilalis]|uniref:protein Aster-A-like isoform X2 n=1 Tax=Ostrinia nubilalis TaxID=29057 RepID=UPI0030825080